MENSLTYVKSERISEHFILLTDILNGKFVLLTQLIS
jgi:hypothetical protein